MSWIMLIISGVFEIMLVLAFKKVAQSSGKKLVLWIAIITAIAICSFTTLSIAMKEINMSMAYAVWTGIGASGGVILSSWLYAEKITLIKFACLSLIIGSMIGLKLLS